MQICDIDYRFRIFAVVFVQFTASYVYDFTKESVIMSVSLDNFSVTSSTSYFLISSYCRIINHASSDHIVNLSKLCSDFIQIWCIYFEFAAIE